MELIKEGAAEKAKELEEMNDVDHEGGKKLSETTAKALSEAIGLGKASSKDWASEDSTEEKEEVSDDVDEEEVTDEEEEEVSATENTKESEDEENSDEDQPAKNYDFLKEQLSNRYGEDDLQTPEQIEAAIQDVLSENETLNSNKETFEAVTNLFEEQDEIVQVAKYLKEGYTFNEALARVIDFNEWQEELKEDDPEEYKKVVKRQMEREQAQKEAEKKKKERQEQFQKNQKESAKNWEKFVAEKFGDENGKVSEEAEKEANKFAEEINKHFQNITDGYTPEDFFDVMYKGIRFEQAIKEAREEGKVEGANKAIEDTTAKTKIGDGTPDLRSGKSRKQKASASDAKKAVVGAVASKRNTGGWR